MDFNVMARQMFALYGKGRFDEALALLNGAQDAHPDEDGTVTFWRACLLGVSGRPEQALETLNTGVERGLWWAPQLLADSDLDSVRTLPGWAVLIERCQAASDAFSFALPSEPMMRPAEIGRSSGTVVTFHGAGAVPKHHADLWRDATPGSWDVVAPSGTVPFSVNERAWPYDHPNAVVLEQLDGLDLAEPVVLAGFSQGSGVAAWLGWKGLLDTTGLLLMAHTIRSVRWDPKTDRRLPTYIMIGDEDWGLQAALDLHQTLEEHVVPTHLDVRAGLGHQNPDDFEKTVARALDWIVNH